MLTTFHIVCRHRDPTPSGADLTLRLAGGVNGWAQQKQEVVTNAVCALFLMSRGPPLATDWLKEGGKITHFLANLSHGGCEVQKKVVVPAEMHPYWWTA